MRAMLGITAPHTALDATQPRPEQNPATLPKPSLYTFCPLLYTPKIAEQKYFLPIVRVVTIAAAYRSVPNPSPQGSPCRIFACAATPAGGPCPRPPAPAPRYPARRAARRGAGA